MKLNVKAFGLACGLVWGLGLFLLTWWILAFEGNAGAERSKTILELVYRGYAITPVGSLIGLIWGFLDGLAGGAIFAWVYNLMVDWLARNAKSS